MGLRAGHGALRRAAGLAMLLALAAGCATTGTARPDREDPDDPASQDMPHLLRNAHVGATEQGWGSYYSDRDNGTSTASGENFDDRLFTAAHKTLAFGTLVQVENLRNGRRVIVRINDRGPYVRGRIIDVSKAAARRLGMIGAGVVPVRITVIQRP